MNKTLVVIFCYNVEKHIPKIIQILKDKMDPRELNGGVFLGLNGLVVKSHGGTDALGFSKALEFSLKLNQSKMSKTIESLVNKNI